MEIKAFLKEDGVKQRVCFCLMSTINPVRMDGGGGWRGMEGWGVFHKVQVR